MSEENKVRDAADAVKGVLQAVPIYPDLIQPAAKELGEGLHTVAKAVNIALEPFVALVWGYDKIKEYVIGALAKRLQGVQAERIISPSPSVAGPTLEALRFAGHDPTLRELYANLLATAMDTKTANEAHPAFVEIIKQLTSDEARILQIMEAKTVIPVIDVRIVIPSGGMIEHVRTFSLIAEEAGCFHLELCQAYIGNLSRLNLIEISGDKRLEDGKCYEPLEQHPMIVEICEEIKNIQNLNCQFHRHYLSLTTWGSMFLRACVNDVARSATPSEALIQPDHP